ncbi:MAG: phage portal protein [Phycisphaerae bacterium]|nr:phage portal protein [Phycisphaerae bacterium]
MLPTDLARNADLPARDAGVAGAARVPFHAAERLGVNPALLAHLLDEHAGAVLPRLATLWAYYRNPMEPTSSGGSAARGAGRGYRLAQERGLPPRVTGVGPGRSIAGDDRAGAANRREVVIENDIAWRVHAMVDFLISKPVRLISTAEDPALRALIERALDAAWTASGGLALLQDAALLGHVHGHVDLVVRTDALEAAPESAPTDAPDAPARLADLAHHAASVRIDIADATRGVPIVSPADYRRLDAYVVRVSRPAGVEAGAGGESRRATVTTFEVLTPTARQVYEDDGRGGLPRLVAEEPLAWPLGAVPVAHVQNVSQPFAYTGLSEVEPLIPLQDELNTRLSDRACRVTMQSFQMYLARGIEGFDQFPVGPGQVWSTNNPDARIEAFGGDGASPSEDAHVQQIREALDKTSGVPPLATGVVQARVGNLSSENALRLTLSGLLARTQRKRVLYGRGIEEASRLILAALDAAGHLRTRPSDRGLKVLWSDPIPENALDALAAAKAKRDLGVEPDRVLAELGYGPLDPGVV